MWAALLGLVREAFATYENREKFSSFPRASSSYSDVVKVPVSNFAHRISDFRNEKLKGEMNAVVLLTGTGPHLDFASQVAGDWTWTRIPASGLKPAVLGRLSRFDCH